jgi:ribosomal protein L37AE/L43A
MNCPKCRTKLQMITKDHWSCKKCGKRWWQGVEIKQKGVDDFFK